MNRLLSLLLLVIFSPLLLSAQEWTQIGPPGGGIGLMTANADTGVVYFFGGDAFFRLPPGETRWRMMSYPEGGSGVFTELFAADGVLLVRQGLELFRTSNEGETWQQVTTLPSTLKYIKGIVAVNDTLYMTAQKYSSLVRSIDSGRTWHAVDDMGWDQDNAIPYASDSLLLLHVNKRIYRYDGDTVWTPIMEDVNQARILLQGDTIVVQGSGDTLRRSFDGGTTWKRYPVMGGPNMALHDDTLWMGKGEEILMMPVGDTAWRFWARLDYALGDNLLFAFAGGRMVIGDHHGMLIRDDATRTFREFEEGYSRQSVATYFLVEDTIVVVAYPWFFLTGDGGETWQRFLPPLYRINGTYMSDGSHFYAVNGDSLYRSSDLGRSWSADDVRSEGRGIGPRTVLVRGDTIIAGGNGIMRSINGGKDWAFAETPTVIPPIREIVGSGDTLFAVSDHNNTPLTRSLDLGMTWEIVPVPSPVPVIKSISYSNGQLYLATFRYGLLRSSDGGATWRRTRKFLPEGPAVDTSGVDVTTLYVDGDTAIAYVAYGMGPRTSAFHISADRGDTWWMLTQPIHGSMELMPLLMEDRLLVGTTNAGLFITQSTLDAPLEQTTARSPNVARRLRIEQSRGTVSWSSSDPAYYRLDLYTLTGEHVALIAEGEAAAGTHALPLDDLPAGTYLCTVRTQKGSAGIVIVNK